MKTQLILILTIALTTGCNRSDRPDDGTTVAQSGIGANTPSITDANKDNLSVSVKTIDRNIQMQNSMKPNPDLHNRARIDFAIRNNQGTSIRDVDVKLLVPPGLKLTNFDSGTTNLMLEKRNDDFTEFFLKRLLEFKPKQELCFSATVEGVESGTRDFEVQVSSVDIEGTIAGRDSVTVSN